MDDTKKLVKAACSRVNMSLGYFDSECISAQRCDSFESRVRNHTFEDYIEARFNREMGKIKELHEGTEKSGGHLFYCEALEESNPKKYRFKKAHMKLITEDMIDSDVVGEDLKNEILEEIEKIKLFLGGSHIIFNSVPMKIRLIIEE